MPSNGINKEKMILHQAKGGVEQTSGEEIEVFGEIITSVGGRGKYTPGCTGAKTDEKKY